MGQEQQQCLLYFCITSSEHKRRYLKRYIHLCLFDFGVRVQELFDLRRVDVLSSSDDHVFYSALDPAVAVRVHRGQVSAATEYPLYSLV